MKLFLMRAVMVAGGVSAMYIESRFQPSPGIGFAIAMMLILGAVFVGDKE